MEATLTLLQAGELLGVDDSDLSRLIRIGALPEARKVDRPEGRVWTIAEEHLPAIASRNGWTIDLRDDAESLLSPDTKTAASTANGLGSGEATIEPPAAPSTKPTAEPEPFDAALVPHLEALPPVPAQQADNSVVEVELSSQVEPSSDSELAAEAGSAQAAGRSESTDLVLLDRLLASHEDRVSAEVREQEARMALSTLADTHNKTTGDLDIERRERMAVAERYREERRARAVADAKVAELRDRVAREMALAEAEKEARTEALNRGLRAERDAANAVALLGWRARRRYRKLSDAKS